LAIIGYSLLCLTHPSSADPPSAHPEATPVEEVTVIGDATTELDRVGPNRQPDWTTRRRFSSADVYVQPPGQIEVSAGWVVREPNEDGHTEHQFLQEIEVGLPYRFQADLELAEEVNGSDGEFSSVGVEARWALAEWGQIFLNPTVYLEWEFHPDEADEFEAKFLLAESVTRRLFTAVNFFYEQQVGGEDEQEIAISNAWSYSVIDRVLGLGAEMRFTVEKEEEEDGGKTEEEWEPLFLIGPSLSWRITDNLNLVVAPLFGVTDESPDIETFAFLRYYFGSDQGEDEGGEAQAPSMEAQ
jgi:hypothetical protein